MVRKRELEQVKDGTETGGAGELKCGSGREKWDIVLEVARSTPPLRSELEAGFQPSQEDLPTRSDSGVAGTAVVEGVQGYFQLCGNITWNFKLRDWTR